MSHLTITPLQYSDDLITNYQSLLNLPGFVLLESSDKQRGRYDIVTACPYDSFKVRRDSPNIQNALTDLQNKLPCTSESCDLPFQGGAIGYFAYDLGEVLAGIQSMPHPSNDMPLIDIGFYDWAIVTDHLLQRVHLVAAYQQPGTSTIIAEVLERWNGPKTALHPFSLKQPFAPLITKNEYQHAFKAIHRELVAGRAYQVCYTQPFMSHYTGEPWDMYKRVRRTNPVPFSAFMRCGDGDVLSFSPERFLCVDQGVVQTSPIKGTAKRSTDPIKDAQLRDALVASAKNRAENVMIVDLLRNDLGKFAEVGSVKVTSLCELQSFNAVHHLVSHIEAQCKENIGPLDVFAACFPGGSITGAPKLEAMRVINEHEQYARGVYCGNIGYFSAHGRFDSNIAIRTLTAKNDSLYLSAGGGIVIDSQCEDEYRECFTKIAAIVNEFIK